MVNIKKVSAGLMISAMLLAGSVTASGLEYTIQRGDSLFIIGQKFGVTVQELREANNINGNLIFAGESITIPGQNQQQTHTVVRGDSLFLIAQRYGTTVNELKRANNLTSDVIFVGAKLVIPGTGQATTGGNNTTQQATTKEYVVVRGDTLFLIAQRNGTTIEQLKIINNLGSDVIYPGQVLRVSGEAQIAPNNNTTTENTNNTQNRIMNVTPKEMDLLARAVYSEARGEPFDGQVAVAAVIFNRVRHAEFPNTIEGVIFEPWAFTAVNDGQFWLTPNQTAYRAVEEALKGTDPSGGAIFYYNPVTATNQWIRTRTIIARIGQHVFAI